MAQMVRLFSLLLLPPLHHHQPRARAPQQHTTHTDRDTHSETDRETERQRKKTKPKYNERFARQTLAMMFGLKKPVTFHNGFMFFATSLAYMYYRESSRTPQHSKWNCVGTKRPQHKHMYGHIVCDSTLNTPIIRIVQKKISAATKIDFESAN